MKKRSVSLLLGALASAGILGGCAYPTEQANVLESRPQISFQTTKDGDAMPVFVDGIRNGVVSDYEPGESALRVLPGTHTISVQMPDGSMITQRVYVGDGVTKTVVLP